MLLLGQIPVPDPTKVIDRASGVSWEAGMLAIIIVVFMSAIVYMIKRQADQVRDDRKIYQEREMRMAKRIDELEDKLREIDAGHSARLVDMIKEVTTAILKTVDCQQAVSLSLSNLSETMDQVNGDIKDLCQLIRLSPCLLAGCKRGDYRIVDHEGKELELSEIIGRMG